MVTGRAIQVHAASVAGWAVAGLGFSLPISTSLDGVLLVMAVVAWIVSGRFAGIPELVRRDRSVLLLPGLFLLLAIGMTHGLASFGERAKYLWKYDDFLLPLVFVPLFADPAVRERGLWGFGCGMAVTLVVSLGLAAGWIPHSAWFHGNTANATVFKHQITHNVLMAFAAFLFAALAMSARISWRRYGLGVLALLAVIDVFMLVQGRTGQIVLGALIILWCERRFGLRGLVLGMAGVLSLVALSYAVSPVFNQRIAKTVEEMERAQVESVAPKKSSVGVRLEWYHNTGNLIVDHPFVGVGTGSFPRAYAEMVTDPAAVKPAHPHNQYLLTGAELGIVGPLVILAMFGTLWWRFRQAVDNLYAELGQGAVLLMAIGCAFNSFFLDHTEGLFFAWVISAAFASDGLGASKDIC
ncbi:MAG: O-antigen ligase family protein [Nitrospira sp.]|nr:O-antigen ligase family protein [Nitrospira sp.]MBH0183428.1 O-antigen ligase family protein [Nitrospira sp.]